MLDLALFMKHKAGKLLLLFYLQIYSVINPDTP
jgi:hypothetical protein